MRGMKHSRIVEHSESARARGRVRGDGDGARAEVRGQPPQETLRRRPAGVSSLLGQLAYTYPWSSLYNCI